MEEENWLVLLRRCWVGRNGQSGNELHGSNDCLGKSATSIRIGVDERLGGPCGSQSLPLGQVQRGVMPVMGGGQPPPQPNLPDGATSTSEVASPFCGGSTAIPPQVSPPPSSMVGGSPASSSAVSPVGSPARMTHRQTPT